MRRPFTFVILSLTVAMARFAVAAENATTTAGQSPPYYGVFTEAPPTSIQPQVPPGEGEKSGPERR